MGLCANQAALISPTHGQGSDGRQPLRGDISRLPSLENRLENIGGQECERQDPSHIPVGNTFTSGDLSDRTRLAGQELIDPVMSKDDRSDNAT